MFPDDDDVHTAKRGVLAASNAAAEHLCGIEQRPCACQPTATNSVRHQSCSHKKQHTVHIYNTWHL